MDLRYGSKEPRRPRAKGAHHATVQSNPVLNPSSRLPHFLTGLVGHGQPRARATRTMTRGQPESLTVKLPNNLEHAVIIYVLLISRLMVLLVDDAKDLILLGRSRISEVNVVCADGFSCINCLFRKRTFDRSDHADIALVKV